MICFFYLNYIINSVSFFSACQIEMVQVSHAQRRGSVHLQLSDLPRAQGLRLRHRRWGLKHKKRPAEHLLR